MTGSKRQIKQFDVFWVNLDPTQGSEIQKTRPCIIVSPDEMNEVLKTITVVPITSTLIDWPFRTTILSTAKISSAACDQIRTITKERLVTKAGSLTRQERQAVSRILVAMFSQ